MDTFLGGNTLEKVVPAISTNTGDCHERVSVARETTYIFLC